MNWFRQNRFLGGFLVALGVITLLSLLFLLYEKGVAGAAQERLDTTVAELTRLRRSAPFPNEENLRQTRAQTESYRTSLLALENELKSRMFPRLPLQPNEFQGQLRVAVAAVQERAAAARVALPAHFNLGFDPYATSLPNSTAAPRLGRQLRAVEWIVNTMIDAHVDGLSGLSRTPLPEENAAPAPTPTPGRARLAVARMPEEKVVDFAAIDLSFSGSPVSVRRVINQIAAARDQFYVIRTLAVRNQVDKGPKRGGAEAAVPSPSRPSSAASPRSAAKEPSINFIVGTEHLDVATRIEIMRFTVPGKGVR